MKEYTQRKHYLGKAITLLVRNIVEDARFTYYNESMFCPCCGMQLRLTPSNREGKERLRQQRRLIKMRN